MKAKKGIIFIAIISLLFSVNIAVAKSSDTVVNEGLVLLNVHTIEVDGEEVRINEYSDNGVKVFSVSDDVSNREKATKEIEEYIRELQQRDELITTQEFNKFCENVSKKGYDGKAPYKSTDAENNTEVNKCIWSSLPFPYLNTYVHVSLAGTQTLSWKGSSPYYPDRMIARQSTEFSGVTLTISWPPSWSISSSRGSYVSSDITGEWLKVVTRDSVSAASAFPGLKYKIHDIADIYVPGFIFKAESIIDNE